MWDDEQVEAAIDEAARQMTAGEPGADVRVRVMTRIEAGSGFGARVFAFRMWRPAVAGLSLAALILVVLFVSREPKEISSPGHQMNPVANSVPGAPKQPDARPEVRLKADATRNLVPARAADITPPHLTDVDAVTLPSIDLEPIAVASLPAAESIHVDPLEAAAPIAVTPLSTENEGVPR